MNLRTGVLFSILCISSIFPLLAQVPCANYGFEANHDFDCDGIVNEIDIDDDNDGIPDWDEACPELAIFEEIKYLEHFQKATLKGNTQLGNIYTKDAISFNYTTVEGITSSATFGPFEAPENKYIKQIIVDVSKDFSSQTASDKVKMKLEVFEGKKLISIDSLIIGEQIENNHGYKIISHITSNSNQNIYIRLSDGGSKTLQKDAKQWSIRRIALNTSACAPDADGDGILNIFDRDQDNDGCTDFSEKNRYLKNDSTVQQHPQFDGVGSNGLADYLETYPDSDTLNFIVSTDINYSDSILCDDTGKDGLINKYDLDDDNDGLLDSLENCFSKAINYRGIPNPDFELYSSLPNNYSQMHLLDGWHQATLATSDFFHMDGNVEILGKEELTQPLNGKGFVGAICWYNYNWLEYVATFLSEPFLKGSMYSFKIDLSAPKEIELSRMPGGDFNGTLVLYGYPTKVDLPFNSTTYPDLVNSYKLLNVPINIKQGEWQTLEVSFTAPADIHTILLGGEDEWIKTLLMDNIRVNRSCPSNDYDNDGIPNALDLDSDNDGCNDSFEGGVSSRNIRKIEQHLNFDSLGNNGIANFVESQPDKGGYNYDFSYDFIDSTVNNCPPCTDSIPPELINVPSNKTFGCYYPQPLDVLSFDNVDGELDVSMDSTLYRTGNHVDSIKYKWWSTDFCNNTVIDSTVFRFEPDTLLFTLPSLNICTNELIQPSFEGLDTSEKYSYTWESADTNLIITDIHNQNPIFKPLKPGSFLVKLRIDNGQGCLMEGKTTLQIIKNAKDAEITGDVAFCENDTILLEALQEANIKWITPLGDTISGQKLLIPSAKLGYAGTYKAIFHFSEYCIDTVFHTIGINRSLTPAPKGATEVCLYETLSLTVAGASDSYYQWFYKDSLISTDQNPTFNSERFGIGEHQLTIFVEPTVGCAGTGLFSFKVNELGDVYLPKDTSVLVNGTISLTADGFKNVIWSGPNNFFSNTSTISFDKVTESNEGFYSYLGVTESGCQVLDSVMLEVINEDDSDTDDSDTDDSDTDNSDTDDSDTDNSDTDDSDTGDSDTDDSDTGDSDTDDSDTDDSDTDDSDTDDSDTDDSDTDDSDTDDSDTDDSDTDDSDTDDSDTDDSDTDGSDTDGSDTDDSDTDDSDTDDSDTDDSDTDDSDTDGSDTEDSDTDGSDTDDSDTDDSDTDDSDTEDSDTEDSDTDDSNTDDSDTDDSDTEDSDTEDSDTEDSDTDDSDTDDSDTDDSDTDDSDIEGSDIEDSDTEDSDIEDSDTDDSDTDDSDTEDSNTDDSDTDDSDTEDSDTEDSEIITVFLDSLNRAEVCFPYDKKGDDFYIQKVCGKGNGVEDIEIVNEVCLRLSGSINSMQENCYALCTNQSCESFRLQIHPYSSPLKLRKDSIVIEQNKLYQLILDENISDSTQINLLYTPESEAYQINGYKLEILSSSMTCGEIDSIIYQVETAIHKDTATLYIEGECLEIIVLNGFSPNGDGINDYFIIQNIETLTDNWVGIFNRNGNLVFQQKNYSNKKPWDGTFNNKKLPEGTYFYVIKTGKNDTVLDGYLILNW